MEVRLEWLASWSDAHGPSLARPPGYLIADTYRVHSTHRAPARHEQRGADCSAPRLFSGLLSGYALRILYGSTSIVQMTICGASSFKNVTDVCQPPGGVVLSGGVSTPVQTIEFMLVSPEPPSRKLICRS